MQGNFFWSICAVRESCETWRWCKVLDCWLCPRKWLRQHLPDLLALTLIYPDKHVAVWKSAFLKFNDVNSCSGKSKNLALFNGVDQLHLLFVVNSCYNVRSIRCRQVVGNDCLNFFPLWVASESQKNSGFPNFPQIAIASWYAWFMALGLPMKLERIMWIDPTATFSLSARLAM